MTGSSITCKCIIEHLSTLIFSQKALKVNLRLITLHVAMQFRWCFSFTFIQIATSLSIIVFDPSYFYILLQALVLQSKQSVWKKCVSLSAFLAAIEYRILNWFRNWIKLFILSESFFVFQNTSVILWNSYIYDFLFTTITKTYLRKYLPTL